MDWRDRIRPAIILAKLQQHVESADGDVMTMAQIKAAEVLLRKVIPDLKSIEHTGEVSLPRLVIDMRRRIDIQDVEAELIPPPAPVALESQKRPRGRPRLYPEGYKAARRRKGD